MIHARPFGTLPTSPIAPSMPGELSYPPLDPGRLEAFFVAFGGEMRRREGADGLIDLREPPVELERCVRKRYFHLIARGAMPGLMASHRVYQDGALRTPSGAAVRVDHACCRVLDSVLDFSVGDWYALAATGPEVARLFGLSMARIQCALRILSPQAAVCVPRKPASDRDTCLRLPSSVTSLILHTNLGYAPVVPLGDKLCHLTLVIPVGSHQVPARAQYLRQLVSSLPDAVIIIVAPVAAVPALKRLCIAAVKSLHLAKPVHIEIRSREEHYHSIGKKCWELEMMFGHDDSEAHDYDARGSGQAMLNDGSDISDDDTAEPREIEDHAGILKIDENVAAEMDRVLGTTRSMSLPGRRLPESCARGE
ncbi:hypothetical protein CcaverHIS002_0309830 [Cutaneotrichosporon cavernicola]|nr:hypothetical protein CcaverHIS002_0309830 [Cutaneotrichosporon cavernicola]BEI98676.1 hypothetical protein CcaverHIS631_0309750 [Cutaneotrichosporon cavernicola]